MNKIVKVFVDDGIVYSKRADDYINDLAKVLKRLSRKTFTYNCESEVGNLPTRD